MTIERYDPNGATLRVRAERDTFIASSEPAMPGWSLMRNGTSWPTHTINGAFLGWHAPRGTSTFRLAYRPPAIGWSAVGTVIGFAILLMMFAAPAGQRGATGS